MRSTGSGMGCPDWPKCFGSWVPPTAEDQLPNDYQETYVSKRLAKNERLTVYLQKLGFDDLADRIANDPTIREEQPFNVVKTWIEYVNRLIGVVIGLLIFATLVASLRYWKTQRKIVWYSLAAFVLTGIQGWIGSLVVSTNLLHGMINVHMFLAIVIVGLLIVAMFYAQAPEVGEVPRQTRKLVNALVAVSVVAMVVQIMMGVEVRALVDEIARSLGYTQRDQWISQLPDTFKVHRSFSLLIVALHGALAWQLMRNKEDAPTLWNTGRWLLIITVVEIGTGAIMGYFSIPAFIQPVHLLFATLIMGVQFYALLLVNRKQNAMQAAPQSA